MADHTLRAGLLIEDRFMLKRQIGSGGCGAVWLASDAEQRGGDVVLKILHPHFDRFSIGVKQLEREADLLFHLAHPNIAKPFAFSARGPHTYLAMELVDGRPLDQEIGAHTRADHYFAHGELLRIFSELSAAIIHAHSRTVVHRDLKPQNVMLARVEGRIAVKVLDFGIAKLTEGSLFDATTFGRRLGSMFYMAPEQCKGESADVRSDVFALGAILFELLTLRRAWAWDAAHRPLRAFDTPVPADGANSLSSVLLRVATAPRPRPSASRAGLPKRLDELLVRALAVEPADRFQTVGDMLDELRFVFEHFLAQGSGEQRGPEFGTEVVTIKSAAPKLRPDPAGAWKVGGKPPVVEPTAPYEEVRDQTERNLVDTETHTALPADLLAELRERMGMHPVAAGQPHLPFDTDRGTAADPDTTARGNAVPDPDDVAPGPRLRAAVLEPKPRAGEISQPTEAALDQRDTRLLSAALEPGFASNPPRHPEVTALSTGSVAVEARHAAGAGTELMFAVPDLQPLAPASSAEETPARPGRFEMVEPRRAGTTSARELRYLPIDSTQTTSVAGFVRRHRLAIVGAIGMVLAFAFGVALAQWAAERVRAPAPVVQPAGR